MHLLIYRLFKIKANGRIYINYNCVREILRRRFHKIPHQLYPVFLKEMEKLKLVKRHGNSRCITYEFIGGDKDKSINQYMDLI